MLDLAEHQEVVDSGGRAGHHVHHAGRHEALGESGESLGGEVVLECLRCRDGAQVDRTTLIRPESGRHHVTVVGGPGIGMPAEQSGQTRSTVE